MGDPFHWEQFKLQVYVCVDWWKHSLLRLEGMLHVSYTSAIVDIEY